MLSICIPIYNYDCTALVNDLLKQMEKTESKVELIVADDASEVRFRKIFEKFPSQVYLIQLQQNVGRSAIRNMLADKAKFNNLLFIDGDSTLISPDFIEKYITLLEEDKQTKVMCGGSVYQQKPPETKYLLRWQYSRSRERKSTSFNRKKPYQSFTTNNVLIKKEVFDTIQFDERLSEYGHEDTLFGYELMKANVPLIHLDNVVENGNLDSNEEYLQKSRESISNLLKIAEFLNFESEFIRFIPLLNFYFKVKVAGLEIFLRFWFSANRKRLERRFKKGKVNLKSFDLYRLGILSFYFKRLKRLEG